MLGPLVESFALLVEIRAHVVNADHPLLVVPERQFRDVRSHAELPETSTGGPAQVVQVERGNADLREPCLTLREAACQQLGIDGAFAVSCA